MFRFLFPTSNFKFIHSGYEIPIYKTINLISRLHFSAWFLFIGWLHLSSIAFAQVQPTNYSNLTDVNGIIFFTADDTDHGNELWRSDGTAAGTYIVKDITTGSASSFPSKLINLNGTLYFIANEGETSYQLWKSDGTKAGTIKIKDVPLQLPLREYDYDRDIAYYRASTGLTHTGNLVYFTVNNAINTYELWRTDGTQAGTIKVTDVTTYDRYIEDQYNFGPFTSVGNSLFYNKPYGGLYKTDGNSQNPILIKEVISPELIKSTVNGVVYFTDFVLGQYRLWKSNGNAEGTVLVKKSISPRFSMAVGNNLFFTTDEYSPLGAELWKSDGTEAGTTLVKDIYPGIESGPNRPNHSSPLYLTNFNNALYFTANDGVHGRELWKSDGTTAGTILEKDITPGSSSSNIYNLLVANNTLFFVYNYQSLWKSDGTSNGTFAVKTSIGENRLIVDGSLINSNGTLYFTTKHQFLIGHPSELWKSDGTEAGTVKVMDVLETPSHFIVTAASRTQVHLRWSIGYGNAVIERSTSANGPFTKIESAPYDSHSYADADLQPNTTYYYRIKAVDENGASSEYVQKSTTTHPEVTSPVITLKQWDKLFTGTGGVNTAKRTTDGNYLITHSRWIWPNSYASGALLLNNNGEQTWSKEFNSDFTHSVIGTDGNFVLASSYVLVKIKSNGTELWQKTITTGSIRGIIQTADGGYLASTYLSDNTTVTAGLVKFNSNGEKLWEKTYGENSKVWLSYFKQLNYFIQTTDGGYLLANTYSSVNKAHDYGLIKFNSNGEKLWEKTYGGESDDILTTVLQTSEGGYLLGGTSTSGIGGDKTEACQDDDQDNGYGDYWVVKVSANGTKEWDKTFGGGFSEDLTAIVQSPDGGYLIGGSSSSVGTYVSNCFAYEGKRNANFWLVKITATGTKQWDKSFFGGTSQLSNSNNSDFLTVMLTTADGGYLLGGTSFSGISSSKTEGSHGTSQITCSEFGTLDLNYSSDYWMIKINGNGSREWDKTFGSFGDESLNAIFQNTDNSFTLVGHSSSTPGKDRNNNGDKTQAGNGIWLVKTKGTLPPAVTCSATGSILREKWLNVTGYSVGAIPVNTASSASAQLTSFETTSNQGDNYGERIRGYLCAPYSGSYTFYLSGDDQCELYLSSDEDPAKKVKIASVATYSGNKEWNKFPSQKSASLSLVAGKKYYIEALHKEATGGDHIAVGWQTPASTAITLIAGSYLSPFIASCSSSTQSSLVVNPSSGSTLSGTSLYLKTIPGASSYTLQVSSSANFTTGVITKTTTSKLSTGTYYASFPELVLNQKYYVRVYTNLGLCWGPVTSFTTASAAGSAYVVNPSDGATTTGTSLYLNTVSGASAYTVQVSSSANFTTGVITKTTASKLSTGTYYAVFPELILNQKYYVRVKTNLSEVWGRTTTFTRVNAVARVGAEEQEAAAFLESKVSLYPNPFESTLTLSTPRASMHYITVADNLGRTVYQTTTQGAETSLDLAHLKTGVYVVKVSTEDGSTQVLRIVKQ
ncbi:T9SS type A sorting domain-containing protein [Rhodocytophaga rosea]|uniref:T9SS type A sorting domain-containing protein n=1 Tax=Rhodocytophaga rosea TaxID=2704465 RepID=A0A6C0GQW2_9BACT|nr:ELWxxDGT repeat protein [Rhodocytophaga rosea]QHT70456.1 T9SS type A sorting domain-containing protein [Rhodocytophaga rosea]